MVAPLFSTGVLKEAAPSGLERYFSSFLPVSKAGVLLFVLRWRLDSLEETEAMPPGCDETP